MISIRSEVEELERIHAARGLVSACYVSAVRTSAEYAIELEATLTEPFRQQLQALADEVASAGAETLENSRATFRSLLRDYRDKAGSYLNKLRDELAGATRGLEAVMEALSRSGDENELNLRDCLLQLRSAPGISDVAALHALAQSAADAVEASLEEMRNQHQLTISQFQAEIRVLHRRIDTLERAASIEGLSELMRQPEIEARITQGLPGCSLLVMKTGGFHAAATQFHPRVAAELTGAFVKRLRNGLPPDSELGRWSEDGFVAVVHKSKSEAVKIAKWISEHLSGAYSCLLDGKAVRPTLHVSVALVDGNDSPSQILGWLSQFLPMV